MNKYKLIKLKEILRISEKELNRFLNEQFYYDESNRQISFTENSDEDI